MSRDWTRIPWRDQTLWERTQNVSATAVACLIGLAGFVGFLWIVGMADDANVQRHIEHDRCLKQATNGYDIQKCH